MGKFLRQVGFCLSFGRRPINANPKAPRTGTTQHYIPGKPEEQQGERRQLPQCTQSSTGAARTLLSTAGSDPTATTSGNSITGALRKTKQFSASLILAFLFSLQVTFKSLKSLYKSGSPCTLVSLQELPSHQKKTILPNSPCFPF